MNDINVKDDLREVKRHTNQMTGNLKWEKEKKNVRTVNMNDRKLINDKHDRHKTTTYLQRY